MRAADGFSLVEAVVALCLTLVVTSAGLALANPAGSIAQAQPESIDTQQRLRAATDVLQRDLGLAGAGMQVGPAQGPLVQAFAPVLPRRIGAQSADGVEVARADAITMIYVPTTLAQATSGGPLVPGTDLTIASTSRCAAGRVLCGFQTGMTALTFDALGRFDLLSLTQVQSTGAQWQLLGAGSGTVHPAGAPIAEAQLRTYYFDVANGQLRVYDGNQTDVPVVDNVVDLRFEYFGNSAPPILPKPPAGTANCLYDSSGNLISLPTLGAQESLVPLAVSQFGDGPWCGGGATQFDADLLRIRLIKVSLRIQSGNPIFRGSGANFLRPGTGRDPLRFIPDAAATISVAPSNLNGGR